MGNTEEINRYMLDGTKYVFRYDGSLWKHRPLDTTNMGWAKFHGTLSKDPYTGVWIRERSDEPEGKEIDELRAVLHCRRIELEEYRRLIASTYSLAGQALIWSSGESWRWSSAEPLLKAAHDYAVWFMTGKVPTP